MSYHIHLPVIEGTVEVLCNLLLVKLERLRDFAELQLLNHDHGLVDKHILKKKFQFVEFVTSKGVTAHLPRPCHIVIEVSDKFKAYECAWDRDWWIITLRLFNLGTLWRGNFWWWGYRPYDGFIVEYLFRVFGLWTRFFHWTIPAFGSFPIGMLISMWAIEFIEALITSIKFVDPDGVSFMFGAQLYFPPDSI